MMISSPGSKQAIIPKSKASLPPLVNAPAAGDVRPFDPEEIEQCERRAFLLLARCGLRIERRPRDSVTTTPADPTATP